MMAKPLQYLAGADRRRTRLASTTVMALVADARREPPAAAGRP